MRKRKKEMNFKHFKELYNLIPKIQEITKDCIQKERNNLPHDKDRFTEEKFYLDEFFNFIQKKWTLDIIHLLNIFGEIHYNKIKKILKGISSRILTDRLKLLKKKGFVTRIVHDTRPVRISYQLTEYGEGFILLLVPIVLFYNFYKN
jgi:DNA-binding HxlR family transcriptional regulator